MNDVKDEAPKDNMYSKYNRRTRSAQWADEYLERAYQSGQTRRAFRAATMIEKLETWLSQNTPL
jgi:hypothetical protein